MAEHKPKGTIGPVTKSATAGTGVAGAAAILIVWILGMFGLEVPEPVAAAIAVLISAIGTLIGGKIILPTIHMEQLHQTPRTTEARLNV